MIDDPFEDMMKDPERSFLYRYGNPTSPEILTLAKEILERFSTNTWVETTFSKDLKRAVYELSDL